MTTTGTANGGRQLKEKGEVTWETWRPMTPAGSPNGMDDSFNQMPEKLKPEYGYHRNCYRLFTKNLDCLKSFTEDSETILQFRTSWRSSTAFEKVILKPDCIFCNKEGQKRSKRKVLGQLKPLLCLNCKAGRQCLKLQKIKATILMEDPRF